MPARLVGREGSCAEFHLGHLQLGEQGVGFAAICGVVFWILGYLDDGESTFRTERGLDVKEQPRSRGYGDGYIYIPSFPLSCLVLNLSRTVHSFLYFTLHLFSNLSLSFLPSFFLLSLLDNK